jgi:hypothetical protein
MRTCSPRTSHTNRRLTIGCLIVLLAAGTGNAQGPTVTPNRPLEFNRDIRPILSKNCLECHGRDDENRQAGLRLDSRANVLDPADSGEIPIVPGQPEASEFVRRIESGDPDEAMPPADSNKSLTVAQKKLLRRWVIEGAIYEEHWAFVPPERHELPAVSQTSWLRNPIDNFILARLEQSDGLMPSPEADRATLFRRLSLDLTGLPPSAGDFTAFDREMSAAEMEDKGQTRQSDQERRSRSRAADRVYGRWVKKLLASPHYGERMAVDWLDAARFADTNGYQVDRDREMFAWRDWVVNAFNVNMPFDQFTVEQLAGDLLPEASLEQRIATGFHRNHMLNEEGGVIPEEFLAEYCADRVETTATVWLGQTLLCARCHDHKFDPFTQRDFYGLYAFFHNVPELGLGNYGANIRRNAPPILKLPAPELEAEIASLEQSLAEATEQLAQTETSIASGRTEWEERLRQSPVTWQAAEPTSAHVGESVALLDEERMTVGIPILQAGRYPSVVEIRLPPSRVTALRLDFAALVGSDAASGSSPVATTIQIDQLQVFRVSESSSEPQRLSIRAAQVNDSLPVAEVAKVLDGKDKTSSKLSFSNDAGASLVVELEQVESADQPTLARLNLLISTQEQTSPWELRVLATEAAVDLLLPANIAKTVHNKPSSRTAEEEQRLSDFRNAKHPDHRRLTKRIAKLTKQIDKTDLDIPTTLVMDESSTPRPTHILIRGAYDKKGDEVIASTPAALPAMSPHLPSNRLGLAKWLVDPANPLTARVAVNRYWQSLFGVGLVRTAEDFGTQGEPPTHPELLDWLATEFVHSDWDIKALMHLLVTSSTYRQSSRLTPALSARDLDNRLLARGARFRLHAEFLRDQALAASGLLVPKLGGPSVKPYHPPGLYEQIVSGSSAKTYVVGKGDELYRRSLYTYWKRSVPNPAMLVFDVPFRETCTMRRSRTNTPLQALNLMNDPTYVEAAQFLAQRMVREGGDTAGKRISHGFRLVLVRPPNATELAILALAYERSLAEFRKDPQAAAGLLSVGDSPANTEIDQTLLAALTSVASTILNLDETVTKE